MSHKDIWDAYKAPDTLKECVKAFFEILDIKEESDSGRVFNPNVISSCRVWDTHRLNRILSKMRELIEANDPVVDKRNQDYD